MEGRKRNRRGVIQRGRVICVMDGREMRERGEDNVVEGKWKGKKGNGKPFSWPWGMDEAGVTA